MESSKTGVDTPLQQKLRKHVIIKLYNQPKETIMYTLRFCTQSLFTMISDYNYNKIPFRFRSGTDMVTTVFADDKNDLVDLAYHIHQWEGAFHSFEEDEVLEVIKTVGA